MGLVDSYLAIRRASGFKLVSSEYHLRSFVRHAEARGEPHIRAETAVEWAAEGRTPHARNRRLRSLMIFARHVHLEDQRHEVPSTSAFPFRPHRSPPHIFSHDEIDAILAVAGDLPPAGSSRPATYQTLLALLVVTGMRVGEALRLTMADITDAGLVIRETKFRKSRLLPLHETTRAALVSFRERWRPWAQDKDPLFVTLRGRAFARDTVTETFQRLLRRIGLRGPAGRPESPSSGPRLHDLRHTFAVRSLEDCPSEHDAIGRHMTSLTTCLGHAALVSTCWYLHASPTLMTGIADACETDDKRGAS